MENTNQSCCGGACHCGDEHKGCCCVSGGGKMHCVKHFFVIVFLIVLSLVGLIWGWSTLKETSLPMVNAPRLIASGEGKITVKPDLVKLSFSVVSEGADYLAVQKDNDEKMAKAINYLKGAGIKEEDIKTTGYNLSPVYNYDWCRKSTDLTYRSCPPKITSYSLRQQVESKIRDIAKTGEILSNLPEKGVNEIYSPVFTIDDPEQIKSEARNKAIINAKEKAEAIAAASGIELGKILDINFSDGNTYPRYEAMSMKTADGIGGGVTYSASPIEAGSQDVYVNVSISYEIK